MLYLILGVLLLVALLVLAQAFVAADPAKLGRFITWFLVSLAAAAAGTLFLLLLFSERLAPALAIAGGALPFIWRNRTILHNIRRAATGHPKGQSSAVETETLRMRLDHDSGAMTGEVLKGRFAGKKLDELALGDLIMLWRQCRIDDPASVSLLEAYLDRLAPNWRNSAGGSGGNAPRGATSDAMTREEALAILGLAPGADAAAVKEAHRRLMMKLHPDQGGSTYLAARINRAKEVLLDA